MNLNENHIGESFVWSPIPLPLVQVRLGYDEVLCHYSWKYINVMSYFISYNQLDLVFDS